jgi:hypothetical protein
MAFAQQFVEMARLCLLSSVMITTLMTLTVVPLNALFKTIFNAFQLKPLVLFPNITYQNAFMPKKLDFLLTKS